LHFSNMRAQLRDPLSLVEQMRRAFGQPPQSLRRAARAG
jgi:hypothetical protein